MSWPKPTDTDWEDVKTFTEVARLGTVRRASEALGVHHSTVSRRLESLEVSLGVRLFDRQPQGLALTESGEELLQVSQPFAGRLSDVERHIAGRDAELTGRITVTMAAPLAELGFAPRLPEFARRYPGLELEIVASAAFLDVARREADVAIRMDNNPPQTLVGRRFFPYHDSIYASRDYLRNVDPANHPERARWLGWLAEEGPFPEWTQSTEFARVPVWGCFQEVGLHMAATRAGLGIAMLPCFVADRDPDLVRITDRPTIPSRDIWLLTHSDLRRTARVRAFLDFATEVLLDNKARLMGVL